MKALLLCRAGRFPHTHDIGELLRLLDDAGEVVQDEIWMARALTEYAVETRYPWPFEPVSEDDRREAPDLATRCVEWVREALGDSGASEV